MNSTTLVLSNSTPKSRGQNSKDRENKWLQKEDHRIKKQMIFSNISLSRISENDVNRSDLIRRDSAPESDLERILAMQNSRNILENCSSANSLQNGLYPSYESYLERERSFSTGTDSGVIDKRYNRFSNQAHLKQSLQTGEFKWSESTLDATFSIASTLNSRQLKFRVILLGDSGVGKSTFLRTLLCGKFISGKPNANLTLSSAIKLVSYCGREIEMDFCDTAGQERYRSITASYYRHAHGCLIFFNVNARKSFEHVVSWLDDLINYGSRDRTAVVLVGLRHKIRSKPTQTDPAESFSSASVGNLKSWSEQDHSDAESSNSQEITRTEAESLAFSCSVPYVEVDIEHDYHSVLNTVYRLLDLLLFTATQCSQNTTSIKPSNEVERSKCCSTC